MVSTHSPEGVTHSVGCFLLIAAFELLAIMCIFIKEHEMDAMHENYKMTPELKKVHP